MNVKTISRSILGGLLSAIVLTQPASAAGTLSGQISVQVTLGSGCSVSNVRNGENNRWGTINPPEGLLLMQVEYDGEA